MPSARTWYRPMQARRTDEEHRAATNLELFFDLCFVVAVAQAGAVLHHDVAEGHLGHAVLSYLMVFFAIWWAWMNFTWFASAYDTDDVPYRLTTLLQITGALILAAGVPRAFDSGDFGVVTLGYVVMRLAMVTQWLRAARSDPAGRATAVRYAVGIAVLQVGWLARLVLARGEDALARPEHPDRWLLASFLVLVAAELVVPIWAERAGQTSWHRRHIAERYGLFTIIVLGETVLAATLAVQVAMDAGHRLDDLLWIAGSGLVIVFSMWWLYFDRPAHELLATLRMSMFWGYGHYLVFASAAAVGAGIAVAVDHSAHHTPDLTARAAGFATALPVAVYLLAVWVLHVCPHQRGPITAAFPVTAALVLAAPFTPAPIPVTAVLLAALVTTVVLANRPPLAAGGRSRAR